MCTNNCLYLHNNGMCWTKCYIMSLYITVKTILLNETKYATINVLLDTRTTHAAIFLYSYLIYILILPIPYIPSNIWNPSCLYI